VLLARTFPRARVAASDLSAAALAVARINVARHRLRRRIRLLRSDLFAGLGDQRYDLIVCNPPYVTARVMRRLPREYRHEPRLALAGGEDGLALLRRLIAQARQHLSARGLLVCETGGNRRALERAYPQLPFAWPLTSAGVGNVFVLEREQLPE
jgi:ribosomal protein L3 glutamine methyltransferase